jgi:hypothetical protein
MFTVDDLLIELAVNVMTKSKMLEKYAAMNTLYRNPSSTFHHQRRQGAHNESTNNPQLSEHNRG